MRRRLDPLTAVLILLCCGFTMYYLLGRKTAAEAGALNELLFWRGGYWRVFTATLLHGNWTHLIMNCISLYFVGTVIADGLGRRVYLGSVVVGALAGFAASLLTTVAPHPNMEYRVGISGAIAGLVGLILAVEWRNSKGVGDFLRQRNTILIMVFITLSVGLGIWIERRNPGVRIDHAAHIGGAVACCAAGLFYYGRRRNHPVRGLVAAVVIGVLPLAYTAFPYWNAEFCVFRARIADNEDAAGAWYERAFELDGSNPIAAAYTAVRRNDPAPLKKMRPPAGSDETGPVLEAYLILATNRFEAPPEEALALVREASLLRPASHAVWSKFSTQASGAGRTQIWAIAARMALGLAQGAGLSTTKLWPYAQRLWPVVEQQLRAAQADEDADKLGAALDGINTLYLIGIRLVVDDELDERTGIGIEEGLVRNLNRIEVLEKTADEDPVRRRELQARLRRIWELLANESFDQGRGADYLFKSAYWWGLSVHGTDMEKSEQPAIAARVERALREARSYKVPKVVRLATLWFRARDLPVPTGDLADIGEDG